MIDSYKNSKSKNRIAKGRIKSKDGKTQSKNIKRKQQLINEMGKCEVCGFSYKPILQVHHILPIKEDGNDDPENLICVCPNCHEILHAIYEVQENGSDIENNAFWEDLPNYYDYATCNVFIDVSNERLRKHIEILRSILNKDGKARDN